MNIGGKTEISMLNSKGFTLVTIDPSLARLLIEIVAKHIGLSDTFLHPVNSSQDLYKVLHDEVKANLKELMKNTTRNTRTIPKSIVHQHSKSIRDLLGMNMRKPDMLINDDLYYRLVVPGETQISVPHRDVYFHNILPEWRHIVNVKNYKLWIPLIQTSTHSLGVIPSSHLDESYKDVRYTFKESEKVAYKCSIESEDLEPVSVPCGSALLFPPSLIHGSLPIDKLGSLRLSIELTLGYTQ